MKELRIAAGESKGKIVIKVIITKVMIILITITFVIIIKITTRPAGP